MKWTYNQLGLMSPLTWFEWGLMTCVLIILIFAGWGLVKLSLILYEITRKR